MASSVEKPDLFDLDLSTAVASSEAPFQFRIGDGKKRYGIRKVVLYAKTSDDSVAGYTVKLKDTGSTKAPAQANDVNVKVDCKSGDTSNSTDNYEFLCDPNLAATHIYVEGGDSGNLLAEIVVAGKLYSDYPCEKGYYNDKANSKGLHDSTDDCKQCGYSSYQDKMDTSDIVISGECTKCHASQDTIKIYYTENLGSTKEDHCKSCPVPQVRTNNKNGCANCDAGHYYKVTGSDADCDASLYDPANKISTYITDATKCATVACEPCPQGKYSDDHLKPCQDCAEGTFTNETGKTACENCPEGEKSNVDKSGCEPCEKGKYKGSGDTTCKQCTSGEYTDQTGATECKQCEPGSKGKVDFTGCDVCEAGTVQAEKGKGSCDTCPDGKVPNPERTLCVPCEAGKYKQGSTCAPCEKGKYQPEAGQQSCMDCKKGYITDDVGSTECKPCEAGYYINTIAGTACTPCDVGYYANEMGTEECKQCLANEYSNEKGRKKCDVCKSNFFSNPGETVCEPCRGGTPDAIDNKMSGEDEKQREKCKSDLGAGCYSRDIESPQYGKYSIPWMKKGESKEEKCIYDNDDDLKARFTCMKEGNKTFIKEDYSSCVNGPKTENINKVIDENNRDTTKESNKLLEELTKTDNTAPGDIDATATVIESIVNEDKAKAEEVGEDVTKTLVNCMSTLSEADVNPDDNKVDEYSRRMVNAVRDVVANTAIKNEVVGSKSVAIMKVTQNVKDGEKPSPNAQSGPLTFSGTSSDLQTLRAGNEVKEDTILVVDSAKSDMEIVVFSKKTFFPDKNLDDIAVMSSDDSSKQLHNGTFIKESMYEELGFRLDKKGKENVTLLNTMIAEIKVDPAKLAKGEKLKFCLKSITDMGGTGENFMMNKSTGVRTEMVSTCAKYKSDDAKWSKTCDTVYDLDDKYKRVCCICTHNTSFAVLMSAVQVDREYANVQSLLTKILLSASTLGLLLTLVFLLPNKALRSTRSAKINICFTFALLIASLVFLIQDSLVSSDNKGAIKLRSTGCIAYTMIQHYLWLVVFMWMGIEGFLMYLSLVQVFGSHISKYMLKFNLMAWGLPLMFPFIGYFAFTKKHVIAGVEIVEHNYLSDKMCFIKAETVAFYTLFFLPLCLVIMLNIVFFVLVVRVIKNSKVSENITDHELILRQLKAAVGVMVLLGTGWFFGVFMSVPHPNTQIFTQYFFIIINSTQGIFVFVFYVVLNDQVKGYWLSKAGLKEKTATTSSAAAKSNTFNTKNTTVSANARMDNIYENPVAGNDDHTYASAEYANASDKNTEMCEFPAKSDDNANI